MSIPISEEGFELVKKELDGLKKERPEIIRSIAEAREEGDLKENAGYHAARERQGMLEARVSYIESRMPEFDVIPLDSLENDKIIYGATVEIEDIDSGEKKEYTLLGPDETNYVHGSISVLSPVARALLGKGEGEEVAVEIPRGRVEYEIISIKYLGAKILFGDRSKKGFNE